MDVREFVKETLTQIANGAADAANHVWAYDFVFDACVNGQQIKCLTVVDEFTHECLANDVAAPSVRGT